MAGRSREEQEQEETERAGEEKEGEDGGVLKRSKIKYIELLCSALLP